MRVSFAVLLVAATVLLRISTAVAAAEAAGAAAEKTAKPPAQKDASAKPGAAKRVEIKHVPDDDNLCIQCHANLTEKGQERFLINIKDFAGDAHFQKGLRCQDCHGGDPTVGEIKAHQSGEKEFTVVKSPLDLPKFCGNSDCHPREAKELGMGAHHKEGPKNDQGLPGPMLCSKCHGSPSHHILPARDSKSPVFLDNQLKTCGVCHEEKLATYQKSVHGQAISKLGLLVAPACSDCHGAHAIYYATDVRSTVNPGRVAETCGKCHRFIAERLRDSVHGPHGAADAADAAGAAAKPPGNAPAEKAPRKPTCTDCHQGHDLPAPASVAFRARMPDRCGNCHANLQGQYGLSVHGELTGLGYGPAAQCSDCHGAHDILPVANPQSRLSPKNRAATCRQCHANARGNFLNFDPHLDHMDAQRHPLVHGIYVGLLTLLFSTFGVFGLHSALWVVRGLVEVWKHGRPRGLTPLGLAYVRFTSFHRVGHTIMLCAFLGLALTGMPLKYSHSPWARELADAWGGFASTGFWHRFFAIVTFGCFLIYLILLVKLLVAGRKRHVPWLKLLFGPDSPMPNFRDIKDFFAMLRWLLGLGPKPGFERWTYWEKLDFWGAAADIIIIGFTGLVLWFPVFFCLLFPSKLLNIAKVIHSTQALLATGFVFAIHFFNTHLRPDKFPADMSVMTGLVSEPEFRDERPDLFSRLEQQGDLAALRTVAPTRNTLWLVRIGGWMALVVGLLLLAGMVVAMLGG